MEYRTLGRTGLAVYRLTARQRYSTSDGSIETGPGRPPIATSVVPISVKSCSYGIAKKMRPSGSWKKYA